MRIGGLASGIDTDSIIKSMMDAKRIPLTKITQKKQTLEWQLESYRAVNRKLKNFSTNTFNNMVISDAFRAKKMEVSAPNDVTITNKNSTSDFAGTINIQQLAKYSTMQSDGIANTTTAGKSASNIRLADLGITGDTTLTIDAIDETGQPKAGTQMTFSDTTKLSDVLDKINKDTGVNAFYDPGTGKSAVTTKNGGTVGTGSEIVVSGTLAGDLGLAGKTVDANNKGQNAIYTVNGLEMTSSTNKVEVNGFEFVLKEANQTDINFSSRPDTEAVMENIVKFVDEYNKLIEELNGLVREKTYRDFKPLSAEEKAAMSEKEIELWEEKAKSGILKNDPIISGMVSEMRSALMGSVDGQGSLKEIGIGGSAYGKYAYQDNGKLFIDEKKLKEAIDADPDKVHKMFSQAGTKTATGVVQTEQGFAQRLKAIAESAEKKIKARAGDATSTNAMFTLGRNLDAMNKQMDTFNTRLKLVENRLWKQFTAMETAIQRANAQSASLMNSFGGGA